MYRAGGNDRLNLPIGAAAYRKKLMGDMITFDSQHNIPVSQQSKYSIPNWILVLACLPPNDTNEGRTMQEIQSIITDLEWDIRERAVRNAFLPMVSRNPKKIAEMSKVVRETLAMVNGIHAVRIVEDGKSCNSYCLGISLRTLQDLVNKKKFVTYSFNLNDNDAVRLLGI